MDSELRAKVFISCGQREGTKEPVIARRIADVLKSLGYEPYIAIEHHSPKSLRENIFRELETSEYFLFVDFKRERLESHKKAGKFNRHRGSLFCHQELAIASFLGLEILGFQQRGVLPLDGLIQAIQGNFQKFSKRKELPSLVEEAVREEEWNPRWKNQLRIVRKDGECEPTKRNSKDVHYFHFDVKNLHRRKIARNCVVFLESIKNHSGDEKVQFNPIEAHWSCYSLPYTVILPNSFRKVDAFFVYNDTPDKPDFKLFSTTTSKKYVPRIEGPGEYTVTYLVVSDNFPSVRASFRLTLGRTLEEIKFRQVTESQA